MRITPIFEISNRQIADQLVTAIEGGIGYWCQSVTLEIPDQDATAARSPTKGCWYDNEEIFKNPDLRIRVVERQASKGNKRNHIIGLNEIERGFLVMSKLKKNKGGHHWLDLQSESGDAVTADVWLQCCVFGEIVYG